MLKSRIFIVICISLIILICSLSTYTNAEIKIYDNNNQYLGILLNMETADKMTVFIPSINASYMFEKGRLENPNACSFYYTIYFESNDCSGTPYSLGPFPVVIDLKCPPYDGYYLPDLSSGKQFVPKSYLSGDFLTGDPICGLYSTGGIPFKIYYEINEIQLPFSLPIAFPLNFKIGGANGDLDCDEDVDGEDLRIFSENYGTVWGH